MQNLSSVLFDYAFNALWEVPLVVAAAAGLVRLLGRARAVVAHRVWVGCLLLAVVAPGLSLVRPSSAVPDSSAGPFSTTHAATKVEGFAGRTTLGHGVAAQVSAIPIRDFPPGRSYPGRSRAWRPSLLQGLCWLYACSVVFAAARLVVGLLRTRKLVRVARPAHLTPELRATLDGCLRAFAMKEITVLSSAAGAGPATVSWPKPLIILPAELHSANAGEMAAAFCHELAHVRRGDFLRNLGYQACGALLYFHPAMHWAMRRLRETREMACDEMAAAAMQGRSEYAHSLLRLAQRLAQSKTHRKARANARPSLALGVFDDGSLERRVMNLIEKKMKQTLARAFVSAALGLGLLAGVVGLSAWYGLKPVFAQSSAQSSTQGSVPSAAEDSMVPAGWLLAGDKPANYRTGVDKAMIHESMPSAYLASRVQDTGGFGTLMQNFSAANYAGKRVRLRGWVQSEDVSAWAGLWMRVDKGSSVAAFDNMQRRPIKGTRGWTSYDVVLDVPGDATGIAFGVLLSGPGKVWINDLKFEVVGPEVATTVIASGSAVADAPVNLGFQK